MRTKIVFLWTFSLLFENTMRLRYCILNRNMQVFQGDVIIVTRVFSSLSYHC